MSGFGTGSNSNGQFWFGGNTFPGFLFKRNLGVGARRSTKFNPGGNILCNSPTYLYNKYKPGAGGIGASSMSTRRAKNRLATVCGPNQCFPCYNTLGQYSNYTHNPNGFIPCPAITSSSSVTPTPTPSPSGPYTVTYLGNGSNGGSVPVDGLSPYIAGSTVTVLGNTFTRAGFIFAGWSTNSAGTGSDYNGGDLFTINTNTTLYAQWVPIPPSETYTLTYNGNGGTGSEPALTTEYPGGTNVTILGNSGGLVKLGTPPSILTNYQFAGWNTQANGSGTNYVGGDTFNITQNTTLYAQWLPPISGVQLVYNFGTSGSGTAPSSSGTFYPAYSAQPVVDNTGPFTRSGFTFAGWNTTAIGSGTSYPVGSNVTMVPNTSLLPITLYAQWSPVVTSNVNLTYSPGTGGIGTNIVTPYNLNTAAPISGNQGFTNSDPTKIFYGWNTAANGTGTSFPVGSTITMNTNKTLFAQWGSPPSVTVTYDKNSNTATGSVPAAPTDYPSNVQVPILGEGSLTNPGYTFLGWNSSSTGAGSLYAPGYTFTSKTVTLFAQWAPGSTIKSCGPTETNTTGPNTWYDIPYAQVIADTTSATQTITIYLASYFGTVQSNVGSGSGPYGIKSFVSKTVITSTSIINNTYTTYLNDASNNNYSQTITNGTGVTYWPTTPGVTISSITFPSINAGFPYLYSSPATFNIESSRVSNGCGIGAYPTPYISGSTNTQFYFFNQGVTLNYSNGTNTQFVNGAVSALYRNSSSIYSPMPLSNYPYVGITPTTDNILTAITIIPSSTGSSYVSPPMPLTTVQYDPNGASGPSFNYTSIPAPQYMSPYTGTTSITISGVGSLVKSGFVFSGWNTQANGTGTPYGPSTVNPTYNGSSGNLILYAQWV
jgi:uncharacterized repeat protein (TIGR02543 family)